MPGGFLPGLGRFQKMSWQVLPVLGLGFRATYRCWGCEVWGPDVTALTTITLPFARYHVSIVVEISGTMARMSAFAF